MKLLNNIDWYLCDELQVYRIRSFLEVPYEIKNKFGELHRILRLEEDITKFLVRTNLGNFQV